MQIFVVRTLRISDCRVCSILNTVPVRPTKSRDSLVCSSSENFTTKQNLYTESLGISEQQSNVQRTFNDIFYGYFKRVDPPCPITNIF